MENYKLDNPIWNSLIETHKDVSIDYENVKFYKPEYCPFGGFIKTDNLKQSIDEYSTLVNSFFVVGEKPIFSEKIILNNNLICNQMILEKNIGQNVQEEIVELTNKKHRTDLYNLVQLAYPGFFMKKTVDLGKYFGIYKNNNLIAVTGERLKMDGYTEVSAVVTHPKHIGKGYAKQLITYVSNHIFSENKLPYLHVAETNFKAIKLYEKLGFKLRKKLAFGI